MFSVCSGLMYWQPSFDHLQWSEMYINYCTILCMLVSCRRYMCWCVEEEEGDLWHHVFFLWHLGCFRAVTHAPSPNPLSVICCWYQTDGSPLPLPFHTCSKRASAFVRWMRLTVWPILHTQCGSLPVWARGSYTYCETAASSVRQQGPEVLSKQKPADLYQDPQTSYKHQHCNFMILPKWCKCNSVFLCRWKNVQDKVDVASSSSSTCAICSLLRSLIFDWAYLCSRKQFDSQSGAWKAFSVWQLWHLSGLHGAFVCVLSECVSWYSLLNVQIADQWEAF